MVTITAETVAAAADRLHGDGTNPTRKRSAPRLTAPGGGSFSTIGPLLYKWRNNQAEAAELAKVDLPDTLADAGSDLGPDVAGSGRWRLRRLWRAMMHFARS